MVIDVGEISIIKANPQEDIARATFEFDVSDGATRVKSENSSPNHVQMQM